MRDLFGMFVALAIICAFAVLMFFASCYNSETKELDIETVEQNIYHTETAVCTLVDTERDEVAVHRRHGYRHKTMLMFYLQVQTTNEIYAFSVPQSVWNSYWCGSTVYVNVDVFGNKGKIYSINDHSVNYEYQLGWFEETPVKRISSHLLSEQAKQTEAVTTEKQTQIETTTLMQAEGE